jgi:hypothetical protein
VGVLAIAAGLAIIVAGAAVAAVIVATHGNHSDPSTAPATAAPSTAAPTDFVPVTDAPTAPPSTQPFSPPTTAAPQIPIAVRPDVELIQQWATALADEDWPTAQAIDPQLASSTPDQMQQNYGGLAQAKIVFLADLGPSGPGARTLAIASLAHEEVNAIRRSKVYCFSIIVTGGTLEAHGGVPATYETPDWTGWAALRRHARACLAE